LSRGKILHHARSRGRRETRGGQAMTGGTKKAPKSGWHSMSPRRAWFAAPLSVFSLLLCSPAISAQPVTTPSPFYLGGDISLESFMQQEGIHYRVGGAVAQNVDKIMYDH